MPGGGWWRARDRLCRTASSSGGAWPRRWRHFLTQLTDRPMCCANCGTDHWAWSRTASRKRARSADHSASMVAPSHRCTASRAASVVGHAAGHDVGEPGAVLMYLNHTEVAIDRVPVRVLAWQRTPLAAGPEHVQDGVDDLAQVDRARPTEISGCR